MSKISKAAKYKAAYDLLLNKVLGAVGYEKILLFLIEETMRTINFIDQHIDYHIVDEDDRAYLTKLRRFKKEHLTLLKSLKQAEKIKQKLNKMKVGHE